MNFFVLLAGCAVGVIATLIAVKALASRRASQPLGGDPGSDLSNEQSLAASQARAHRLQGALDAMPYGVMVADQNGQVLLRNKAADTAGSDAHNEVLVQAAVQYNLRSALRGEARTQTVELYGPPKRVVVVEAHPLDPDGAMVTVEDVTERFRLDAVRTDFVANISH